MLLCNRSHSASNDHQLETDFINHWVITNALMNNGHYNFRNSHLAETAKVTKHFSQSKDSDQWKMKPRLLGNLFSDKLMEVPTEWVLFSLFGSIHMTLTEKRDESQIIDWQWCHWFSNLLSQWPCESSARPLCRVISSLTKLGCDILLTKQEYQLFLFFLINETMLEMIPFSPKKNAVNILGGRKKG